MRDDTVDQAVASVRWLGHHRRILLKTDNEPALVDQRPRCVYHFQRQDEGPPSARTSTLTLRVAFAPAGRRA
eukprot:1490240-Alexandrium_andersonii.AAC.1